MTIATSPPASPTPEPSPRPPDVPEAPPARDTTHVVGGIWLIVLAVFLFLCGGCSTVFYILIPLRSRDTVEALSGNVVFGALAGVGLVLGAALLWQGIVAALDRTSMPAARVFPPFGILALVFIGAVLLGIAALSFAPIAPYAFPPWHFLAALLAPLILLAFAARRLGQTSGFRALLISFSWGALGATLIALVLEVLVVIAAIIAGALVISALPNSRELLDQLRRVVTDFQRTGNTTALEGLLSNPWVSVALVVYFALIIPPIEEAVKALVVAFIDPLRTRRADALLWGMAAGAGFAMMENMFNSTAEVGAWAFIVILRVGAAIVHVTNGANMGLGWYAARKEGNWSRLAIAYLVSMAYHAAWNATAVFLIPASSSTRAGLPIDLSVVALALLGFLFILAMLGLAWTIRAVRRERQGALAAAP